VEYTGDRKIPLTRSDRISLGIYPTPVERIFVPAAGAEAECALWIKRDDASSAVYGGNKVRKLELLFGAARAEGKTRILTVGAAGSHQVVATAVYGKREGFTVDAVLVPQPASGHGRNNLRAARAHGLHATVATSWPAAPAMVAARLGRDAYFVPLGGSNALGSLGFVEAAKELAGQVAAGLLPEPESVVVAMGSGGTAAGLAVGFEAMGMRTKVIGVAISAPVAVLGVMARRVAKKTAALAGLSRGASVRALGRIELDKRWLGRGYGYSTREGDAATRAANRVGIALAATYTAKAFACALDRARARPGGAVLYWHTLSTAPIEPLLAGAEELPADLAGLFR
jgi:1-aminocyclopropane-1-carboxylate deaminase/D-cysteine desulfhydrase-like pyridoxal-dependent ACC family enzyme